MSLNLTEKYKFSNSSRWRESLQEVADVAWWIEAINVHDYLGWVQMQHEGDKAYELEII